MRKKLIMALLLICSLQMVFASATQLIGTRQIHVSGVLGDMHSISVTPISSTSIDSAEGMPFDLRSEDVAAQPGRRIATWSLHSNYLPVTLKVDADDLKFTSNGTVATVPYVLRFAYSYPVYSTSETGESESELESGFFFIGSEGAHAEYGKTYTFGAEEELQGLEVISSPESDIRFFLALPDGKTIDDDTIYPPGDPYVATVTLTIEGTI